MAFLPLAPLVAGAAVAAVAATAFAQAPGSLPKLAPVVVESNLLPPERTRSEEQAREDMDRTPGGVELVPQKTIEDSRAANLKDALDFVPGVLVRPRFGAADESQFSIRGSGLRNNFHLRGINLLIDGFPYGNADGFSDFESLELLNARYIEVFKGANALRFGGNTMGGAVNFVSKTGSTANSANTVRTPAYTLLNVKVGFDYRPWNLGIFFEGRNLTDKPFVSAVNVDDANGNYFFPGDQRGFYGSVAWKWK